MWRINEYKKMFNIEAEIELKQLKKSYRTLMKDWHPDKFLEEDKKEEASEKSQKIIQAYKFLESIAPETKEATHEEYQETINKSKILDYDHKGSLLTVEFSNGTTYEYFGVKKKLFEKFHNSDIQVRFGKRNIFNTYLYRKTMNSLKEE